MQHCSGLDAEVLAAIAASERLRLARPNGGDIQASAVWAGHAVRPAVLSEPGLGLLFGVGGGRHELLGPVLRDCGLVRIH